MRAAVFYGRGDLRVEQVPNPRPGAGELLIEVHAVGICGTDAHEFNSGPHMFPTSSRHPVSGHVGPVIPGHELAGIVREIGRDVTGFALGDVVASGAGVSCGQCLPCRRGRANLCDSYATVGLHRDGGLAQFCALPALTCQRVEPYGLTVDTAALGQPMSIAVHAMRRGRLQPGDEAVIIGAGGIGAFLTYAACSVTEQVVVADLDDARLRTASDLGATDVFNVGQGTDLLSALSSWGVDPTVVYEVSGTRRGLDTALSVLPPGGRLVLVGLQSGRVEWDVRGLSLAEHEVIGTNAHVCGTDLPTALELLAGRRTPWDDVAPVALALDDVVDHGLRPLVRGDRARIKTLVDPWTTRARPTDMVGAP